MKVVSHCFLAISFAMNSITIFAADLIPEVGIAAVNGRLENVKTHVEAGAKISGDLSKNIPPALVMAAQGGNVEVARYLLNKNAQIDEFWGLNGHTALIEATFGARVDMVRFLLAQGAASNVVTVRGLTPSDLAQREAERNPDMAKIRDMLNEYNKARGMAADNTGRYDVSAQEKQDLLNKKLDIIDPPRQLNDAERLQRDRMNALLDAAEKGDFAKVKGLIENDRLSPNQLAGRLGTTPLILASVAGKTDVVNYLLQNGANPNIHELHPMGIGALFKAAVFGQLEIARALIKAGALVNEHGPANGMTPLHDAIFRGRVELAQLLLENGADIDAKDYLGRTAGSLAGTNEAMKAVVTKYSVDCGKVNSVAGGMSK